MVNEWDEFSARWYEILSVDGSIDPDFGCEWEWAGSDSFDSWCVEIRPAISRAGRLRYIQTVAWRLWGWEVSCSAGMGTCTEIFVPLESEWISMEP
jgi:hypothetical protein